MVTIKLSHTTTKLNLEVISNLQRQQSNAVRFLFNRIHDSLEPMKQKVLTRLVNRMNHIDDIDSWFRQSAVYIANDIASNLKSKLNEVIGHNSNNPSNKRKLPKVIFGGRKAFKLRSQHKLKISEIKEERTLPLCSIGESNKFGNRKFELQVIEENRILFKPKRGTEIFLQLPHLRKNYKKQLTALHKLMEEKRLPVMFQLDQKYVYISYEPIPEKFYSPIHDRFMTVDLNPNYVGYSILDWNTNGISSIVKTGMISIKTLNDNALTVKGEPSNDKDNLYWNHKREHEIFEISKQLSMIAQSHNVEVFGIEGLNIRNQDNCLSRKYNRLVNNFWCRDKMTQNLVKRLKITGIIPLSLPCAYSSFVGNLLHRDVPDAVAASIELNRRVFAIVHRDKTSTIFPSFKACRGALIQSLEEIGQRLTRLLQDSRDWKDLYGRIKNLKVRYRVPLDRFRFKVFRLGNEHSFVDMMEEFSVA